MPAAIRVRLPDPPQRNLARRDQPALELAARRRVRGGAHERLVWLGLARQPRRDVDRAAIPVAALHHRRAGVHSNAHRQQVRPRAHLFDRAAGEGYGRARVGRPDHDAVAHRLDLTRPVLAAEPAHRAPKLARQPCGRLVASLLGQRR
jgi:hypothetical protein